MARIVVVCLVLAVATVWTHTHSHGHTHEPPHFKYSKEANEAVAEESHHGHTHGPGGGCSHSHGHEEEEEDHYHLHEEDPKHAHIHEASDHGHTHEPAGSHGHSHGGKAAVKRAARFEDEYQYTGMLTFLNDQRTRLWVYAIGATLLISFAPFVILFFIPVQGNAEGSPLLKVLLAFGSGGLLGDAFLHLIPHATPAGGGHGHSHSASGGGHSHGAHDMSVGGWILAGIISFLAVEKFVRILRGESGHSHAHSHVAKLKVSDDEKSGDEDKDKKKTAKKTVKGEEKKEELHVHEVKVAAYLNLVADFAHNFTDGLAIGASFIAGPTIGFVTMITVLVHEVPHEIGDFAILIQSGFTKKKAMCMQLVTAAGALSGCALSLIAADGSLADAAASSWVLPFTAGGFIYIATVSVIPELLENSSFWQSVKEILAIFLGIFLMYLIAIYE